MKKIILLMLVSFGMMNVLAADACQVLANTKWDGTVTLNDGSTTDLNVTIQTVTPDPTNQGSYVLTGIANNVSFVGSNGSMDNQCSLNMFNSAVVQSLTIANSDSSVNFLSQNVSASQIAGLHGRVSGKSIQSGSINKQ